MVGIARPPGLPDFERPPINEVVLSVQFKALSEFGNGHVGLLWERFRSEYPELKEHAVIQPTFETFGVSAQPSQGLQIERLLSPPMSRFWFVEANGHDLIQVQQDRFLHNWRKREDEQRYPHYEAIRERFSAELNTFASFLKEEQLGELLPNQCEVTYVNVIALSDGTNAHQNLEMITPLWTGALSETIDLVPDSATIQARYVIHRDEKPIGRVHVSFTPAHRVIDKEPVIRMEITARARPSEETIEAALRLLDRERIEVVKLFTAATTPAMHAVWERIYATQ